VVSLRRRVILLLKHFRQLIFAHRAASKTLGAVELSRLRSERGRDVPEEYRNATGDDLRGPRGCVFWYYRFLRCRIGDEGHDAWNQAKAWYVRSVRELCERYSVAAQDHARLSPYIVY
jgi:hypothetical protein